MQITHTVDCFCWFHFFDERVTLVDLSLAWSEWTPFDAGRLSKMVPGTSGLYRVRSGDRAPLMYLGQTGRDLGERLNALRRGTFQRDMPFNDPHTASPGLWAYRVEESYVYEISWVPKLDVNRRDLRTLEAVALAEHRQWHGESTLLNHGRFHPAWSRPGNRKAGIVGARLGSLVDYLSSKPLARSGKPGQSEWMGLNWSEPIDLRAASSVAPKTPGLYVLLDGGELIYIGETRDLRRRCGGHRSAAWPPQTQVRWSALQTETPDHHLLEFETDLLGAYIDCQSQAPRGQFIKGAPLTG